MDIFLALLHHPVLDRHGNVSTTALTNVDLHDLARSARTYGVERFFVVTPIELQQELIRRVLHHWTQGTGAARIPTRADAMSRVELQPDLEATIHRVSELAGAAPLVVATGAGFRQEVISAAELRQHATRLGRPALILLGTGHGLAPSAVERADIRLPAIDGPPSAGGYNHLSVRSAGAILLDRLCRRTE